ncbi:hypothetical protein [Roseibium sp.]|uniref:hypothetical protein n=1 Tax=Roseibium sp. TaxID=1936156 RepID=UPI003B508F05
MTHPETAQGPVDIGPHEGLEFALMRAGEKNVALFFEIEPGGLDEILSEGYCLVQFRQFLHEGRTYFTRIVFREGFEADEMRLKQLVSDKTKGIVPAREHEIGKILSYTPDKVNSFIRHASSLETS